MERQVKKEDCKNDKNENDEGSISQTSRVTFTVAPELLTSLACLVPMTFVPEVLRYHGLDGCRRWELLREDILEECDALAAMSWPEEPRAPIYFSEQIRTFVRAVDWHVQRIGKSTDQCSDVAAAAFSGVRLGQIRTHARIKFGMEQDAIRGEKVAGGRRNSAHATNAKHIKPRNQRLTRMAELIERYGGNVSRAAHQCEAEGL